MFSISSLPLAFSVSFTPSAEADVEGYRIHAQPSSEVVGDLVPSALNLVYQGPNTTYTHVVPTGGIQWTFRVAPYDTFGMDNLNYGPNHTVTPGLAGAAGLTYSLSNGSHFVTTASDGSGGDYSGAATTMTILKGGLDDSANWTYAQTKNPNTAAVTVVASGTPVGRTAAVTGISAGTDNAEITITATGTGENVGAPPLSLVFSVGKLKTGADGSDAASFSITNATAAFKKDKDNNISPISLVLTTAIQNIVSPSYQWKKNGVNGVTTSTYTVPSSDYLGDTVSNTYSCTVTGTVNGVAGQTFTDSIIIPRLDDGSNALSGQLTNGAHIVHTDSAGAGGVYTTAGGTFTVFLGTVNITTSCTFSIVGTPVGITGAAIGTNTGIYSLTGCSLDAGSMLLRATYTVAGVPTTIDLQYSISKSKDGAGITGVTLFATRHIFTATEATTTQGVDAGVFSGVMDAEQADILITANLSGVTGTVVWTSSPVITLITTGSNNEQAVVTAANFGNNNEVIITATCNGVFGNTTIMKLTTQFTSQAKADEARVAAQAYALAQANIALAAATTAQSTADGKIKTFYQTEAPITGMDLGDIWFDTNDSNKLYTYQTGTGWTITRDSGIATAIANASTAQGTADGKAMIYYQTANPGAKTSADIGDMWIDTDDNNKLWIYNNVSTGAPDYGWVLAQDYYSAKIRLDAIDDPLILTKSQKIPLRLQLDVMRKERDAIVATAASPSVGISSTAYQSAFTALETYLTGTTGSPTFQCNLNAAIDTIIGDATHLTLLKTNFETYATALGLINKQISEASATGNSVYTATIFLQNAAYPEITAPPAPTGGTFNFSTATLSLVGITGTNSSMWTVTQPATALLPTWACTFTFVGSPISTITAGTWSNVYIDSIRGANGAGGTNMMVVELYQEKSTSPAVPVGTPYTFSTNTPTGIGAWATSMPNVTTVDMWLTTCRFVSSTDTATSGTGLSGTWTTPVVVARKGIDGTAAAPNFVVLSFDKGAFVRNTSAAAFSPTSITLTMTAFGGGAVSNIRWYKDGVLYGGTAATQSVPSGDSTTAATYKVTATIAGVDYSDQATINWVTGGADGTSPIYGYLTNPSVVLNADLNGTVASLTPTAGVFKVFQGNTDVTASAIFGTPTVSGCTMPTPTAGTGAYTLSTLTASTATATMTATYGGVTVTCTLTVAKSITGATGVASNGDSVDIVFVRSLAQPATPDASAGIPTSPITWYTDVAAANSAGGIVNPMWSSVGQKVSPATVYTWGAVNRVDGSKIAEVTVYTRGVPVATPTGGSYTFGNTSPLTSVPTSASWTGGTTENVWSATIPTGTTALYTSRAVVSTSADNTAAVTITGWSVPVLSMKDGVDGTSALTFLFSNPVFQLPADVDGNITTFANSGFTLQVLDGTTALTCIAAATATTAGKFKISGSVVTQLQMVTVPAYTGANTTTLTMPIYTANVGTAPSVSTFIVTHTISGQTLLGVPFSTTRVQSFSKSIPGATGSGDSVDIVFVRSATQPATPTASSGAPTAPITWYTDVAAANSAGGIVNPMWSSVGQKVAPATVYTWGAVNRVDGSKVAEVSVYTRYTTTPTISGGSYTFGNASPLTTAPTGTSTWTAAVPAANGNPLYISRAVVSTSADNTAAVAITGWSTPVISMQDGAAGANVATAKLYLRTNATTTPAHTTTGSLTYTFATGGLSGTFPTSSGEGGTWSSGIPSTGGDQLWVMSAPASGTGTAVSIANTAWDTPVLLARNGLSLIRTAVLGGMVASNLNAGYTGAAFDDVRVGMILTMPPQLSPNCLVTYSASISPSADPSGSSNYLGVALTLYYSTVSSSAGPWVQFSKSSILCPHSKTGYYTGSISGTILTITAVGNVPIPLTAGDTLRGEGMVQDTKIVSRGTGTGGIGTYNISKSQTMASTTVYNAVMNTDYTLLPVPTTSALEVGSLVSITAVHEAVPAATTVYYLARVNYMPFPARGTAVTAKHDTISAVGTQ